MPQASSIAASARVCCTSVAGSCGTVIACRSTMQKKLMRSRWCCHPLLDRAQVVAEVELAGRLDAGEDPARRAAVPPSLPACSSVATIPNSNKKRLRRHRGERRSRCHPSCPSRKDISRTRPRCEAMSWALISVPSPASASPGYQPFRLAAPGSIHSLLGAGLSPVSRLSGALRRELLLPFTALCSVVL